jgi:hypothetical protein
MGDIKKSSDFQIIIYSSLFIICLELFFLKLGQLFFPITNTLPLLFTGIILNINSFLVVVIITNFFFYITSVFEFNFLGIVLSQKLFLNFVFISFVTFFFIYLLNLKKKLKIEDEKILISFNVFLILLLILFNFFYFYKLEHLELKKSLLELSQNFKINSVDPKLSISEQIIEDVIKIIPAVYFFNFLIFFVINIYLSDFLTKKLKITSNYVLNNRMFNVSNSFFIFFNFFFLSAIFFTHQIKFYILSIAILMSFLIFSQGFKIFLKKINDLDINFFVKILIIFLLFYFFGIYIFLIIFIAGYFVSLANVFNKKI